MIHFMADLNLFISPVNRKTELFINKSGLICEICGLNFRFRFRFLISGFRFRFQVSGFRFQVSGFRFLAFGFKSKSADFFE